MARARDPNRDRAFEIYKEHNGEITNRQIAEMLNVPEKTISAWKSREKWIQKLNKNDCSTAIKKECSTTIKKVTLNQQRQREKKGNPNPQNQFSHRNNPKLIHGLRSKFFNQEQIEIMEAFEGLSLADKIWLQLEIKFSAIIRMQRIMWVEDENDTLKELSSSSSGESSSSEAFKVVYAHERYESYIKAQTRAMAEYRNLADSFLKHAEMDDERRLKLEHMQATITKTNAEIDLTKARVRKETGEEIEQFEDDGFIEALNAQVGDVWSDVDDEE